MVVLKDTSLCAIVKDEIMNPAGGILDFVDSTVPFVEEAVIVDTGSVDGTREVLEECRIKYKHLKVRDRPFDNYAASRNFSLEHATKKWALILDADERLTEEDFEIVAEEQKISRRRLKGYNLPICNLFPSGEELVIAGLNPRLFFGGVARFHKAVFEEVVFSSNLFIVPEIRDSAASIKHFLASREAMTKKGGEWYGSWPVDIAVSDRCVHHESRVDSPRDCTNYQLWKKFNPQREKYR